MTAQVLQIADRQLQRHHIEVMTVTPEIAREWLTNHSFEFQRGVRSAHVAYLTRSITNGTFDGGEPIRHVAVRRDWEADGSSYLVNGQHRLRAIISAGMPQEMIVITTIVEDSSEVSRIYARIDRGRMRTIGDVMRASPDFEDHGLTSRAATLAASAASIIEGWFSSSALTGNTYENRSADSRREIAIKYAMPTMRYIRAIDSADTQVRRAFMRRVVAAIGIATYDSPTSEPRADEFWKIAALDDGLSRNDPRRQLVRLLFGLTAQHSLKERNLAIRGVAQCWNAFYNNEELSAVRPPLGGKIRIMGTRFEKGKDAIPLPP